MIVQQKRDTCIAWSLRVCVCARARLYWVLGHICGGIAALICTLCLYV